MQSFAHRGDTGIFRTALVNAGFHGSAESMIFNDKAKKLGFRRLKLWMAAGVQSAPQAAQQKLADELKKGFGDRFEMVYLIRNGGWTGGGHALCVRLKN